MNAKARKKAFRYLFSTYKAECVWCGCRIVRVSTYRAMKPHERRCVVAIATIEHVLPRSHGGTNKYLNLRLACASCNTSRGDGWFNGEAHAMKRCPLLQQRARANKLWLPMECL